MKKLMLAIAMAGLFAAPAALNAQDGGRGEGGEWGGEGTEGEAKEGGKSVEEMIAELHKLMKKASDEMGELENELAKASLDSPKADVIAERVKKLKEAMEQGKLDEMPEGLRKQIEENPQEVAKATGKSNEEIKKIAQSSDELTELLRKNPELLKKLSQSQDTMDGIIQKQQAAEKKIEETLKKQDDAVEAAKKELDDSLELAHDIKAKSQGQGQGQGQPKNDKGQQTKDPKEGEGNPQGGNNKKPSKGAEEGYQPGEGEMKPEDKVEEYERAKEGGFQADKKNKDMKDGASSDDKREPAKYKDFWDKFNKEVTKKTAERKKDE
ncbi:MAG: hypothetical protein H6839_03165 [Planctomycetes bacterium]|nr:hypothetical protein [Planctomycetota bacterium]